MWVSAKFYDLLQLSKDTATSQREDLALLRAERDLLRDQLAKADIFNDWLRVQINSLQFERTGLIEKAYGIRVPTPEITKAPSTRDETALSQFGFDHIDDDMAKKLGIAHLLS